MKIVALLALFLVLPNTATGTWNPFSEVTRMFKDAQIERCISEAELFYSGGYGRTGFRSFDVWKVNKKDKTKKQGTGVVTRLNITMEGRLILLVEREPPPQNRFYRMEKYEASDPEERYRVFGQNPPSGIIFGSALNSVCSDGFELKPQSTRAYEKQHGCERIHRMTVDFACAFHANDSEAPFLSAGQLSQ